MNHPALNAIKRQDLNGTPFWLARDLVNMLECKWEHIIPAIHAARRVCEQQGLAGKSHLKIENDSEQWAKDVYLSELGCDLVLMNCRTLDIPKAADFQMHFLTRVNNEDRAEQVELEQKHLDRHVQDVVRVKERNRFSGAFNRLSGAAKANGVFGQDATRTSELHRKFNLAGIKAFYGMEKEALRARRKMPNKSKMTDYMSKDELKLRTEIFSTTQSMLNSNYYNNATEATVLHERVAKDKRNQWVESGNIPPEDIPMEKDSIADVHTRIKCYEPIIISLPYTQGFGVNAVLKIK